MVRAQGVHRSLYDRALGYLTRREHSRFELQQKLRPFASGEEDVQAVLDRLVQAGWQSDQRYACAYVQAYQRRYGLRYIAYQLRERGVAVDLIDLAIGEVADAEISAAKSLFFKRFEQVSADYAQRSKQVRFLQRRGFSPETIREIVRGEEER